jgi:hypothetical protein
MGLMDRMPINKNEYLESSLASLHRSIKTLSNKINILSARIETHNNLSTHRELKVDNAFEQTNAYYASNYTLKLRTAKKKRWGQRQPKINRKAQKDFYPND